MKIKFYRSFIVCVFLLTPSFSLYASTVVSDISGFSKVVVSPGGRVIAPLFVKPALFQGNVSFRGQSIILPLPILTASNWNANSSSPSPPSYYAEVVSGPFSGMWFDILSNSPGTISISGDASLLNTQSNVPICVRSHTTLGDLSTAAQGLSDYSDAFTLYGSNNIKTSFYYTSAGVLADDYSTPASGAIIYPGTAVVLNAQGNATFTFTGNVKTNQTLVPVFLGENLLAPINPVGGGKLTEQNLSLAPLRDTVNLISTDGKLGITRFYYGTNTLLDSLFLPVPPASIPIISVGNGVIITSSSFGFWTNLPVPTN